MYSLSSVSKRLVLVHIFSIQLFLIRNVSSLNTTNAYLQHKCIASQGKYQPGSAYEKNLNQLIHTTSKGNFRSGFDQISLGEGLNFVTLMYQCRGDSYGPKCRSCYAIALSELRKRCPRNKGRIIWYDQCVMEISSISSKGKIDYDNNFCMSNVKNMSGGGDMAAFKQIMVTFIGKLGLNATNEKNVDHNNKPVLYATGEEKVGTQKNYAMVQCRKDLWSKSCEVCLDWIIAKESYCCEGKQGGRVFSTSCNYRYEVYPFIKTVV